MNTQELRLYLEQDRIYNDKIKVIKTHATEKQLQEWTIKVTESVLENYEKEYPNDTRVRDCIQATKDYLAGTIGLDELESKRNAANSAAYAAYNAAYAANSRKEQEELNIKLMVDNLELQLANTEINKRLYKGKILRETEEYIWI